MTKHTPGFWHHKDGQVYELAKGRTLAVLPYYDGSQDADGALMASAPQLYAALEALTDWAREHTGPRDDGNPRELLIEGLRALSAARGG